MSNIGDVFDHPFCKESMMNSFLKKYIISYCKSFQKVTDKKQVTNVTRL